MHLSRDKMKVGDRANLPALPHARSSIKSCIMQRVELAGVVILVRDTRVYRVNRAQTKIAVAGSRGERQRTAAAQKSKLKGGREAWYRKDRDTIARSIGHPTMAV